jgi:hypothetical protein
MSAPALGLDLRNTATSSGDSLVLQNFRALNKLLDAISDVDLYESNEVKISPSAVIAAAEALEQLTSQEVDKVEIEPYSGELSLIWRAGRDKRVKAMFGPEKNSYSLYYERMLNGRVVEQRLEPNANHAYLKDRLAWLQA